jgi:hypothetical protein
MAVFAPMPTPSAITEIIVKLGFFTNIRSPYVMSCHNVASINPSEKSSSNGSDPAFSGHRTPLKIAVY